MGSNRASRKLAQALRIIALVAVALGSSSCARKTDFGSTIELPSPLEFKYCTTWVNFRASGTTSALSVVCLDNGHWTETKAPAESDGTCGTSGKRSTGYPELFQGQTSSDLLIGYEKCPGFEGTSIEVLKYSDSGWKPFTTQSLIPNSPTPTEIYSQFGPKYFYAFNRVYTFWTSDMGTKSYLSYASENGAWTKITLPETTLSRHTEHYESADGRHFIYYGQPKPRAFEVTSSGVTDLGAVTTGASEYTLYTSFIRSNNKSYLAYTTNTGDSWTSSVAKVSVAVHQGGTTWAALPTVSEITDTPGYDEMTPHLFEIAGELHILYADYTTQGLPTNTSNVSFNFRVKRYNGTTWVPVGTESPRIWLSQRFEFTQENDRLLFTALALDPADSTQLVKRVFTWEAGAFGTLGDPISLQGNKDAIEHYSRPGRVTINPTH